MADLPSLEPGGPREYIYFDPSRTRAGIVTCGGLCPGLNNVIRGLVLELADNYGVTDVFGFRDGFRGLADPGIAPLRLSREVVADIHNRGGTVLGTSRGDQDPSVMMATLARLGISVLFVIGGDGSLRGAAKIADAAERRGPGAVGHRGAEDDRQRHPVPRPELRVPDRVHPGHRVGQVRADRGQLDAARGRAGQGDGQALRVHRLLRGARQP